MGLDIVAMRGLERLPDHQIVDQCYDDDHIIIRGGDFPQRLGSLAEGCYKQDENLAEDESGFSFRAGSYSGYNEWRRHLALMAHNVEPLAVWERPDQFKAFSELIDFSDCDGTLGTDICQKLAADFHTNLAKAEAYSKALGEPEEDIFAVGFFSLYKVWMNAFDLASDRGCVRFC